MAEAETSHSASKMLDRSGVRVSSSGLCRMVITGRLPGGSLEGADLGASWAWSTPPTSDLPFAGCASRTQ
jgi:hypothetical protein